MKEEERCAGGGGIESGREVLRRTEGSGNEGNEGERRGLGGWGELLEV